MSPADAAANVARKVVRNRRKIQAAERVGLWSAIVWLMSYAPTMLDRVDATFARHEQAYQIAQEKHEKHTNQIIEAHQQEVKAVIEQWKQDRAMIIDLLKDGKLDNPSAYHGSQALMRAANELAKRMEPNL